MLKRDAVQGVLNAFLGLFTQPFEQDVSASVKAAATSVSLAGLLAVLLGTGTHTAIEFGRSSLVVALVWMTVTALFSKAERRRLAIARSLSVVSFWIAVTLVLLIAAEHVFLNPLDRAMRLVTVCAVLVVFVPVHMIRIGLSAGLKAAMIVFLLASTVFLAHSFVY